MLQIISREDNTHGLSKTGSHQLALSPAPLERIHFEEPKLFKSTIRSAISELSCFFLAIPRWTVLSDILVLNWKMH